MAAEIELKARVDDPETLRIRLEKLGKFLFSYEKDDTYWRPTGILPEIPASGVRIRREHDTMPGGRIRETVLVTCKFREMIDGVEINDEREFEVSDGEIFGDLLKRLGFTPAVRKYKKGRAWDCDGIRAELSEVRDLGWFLELEITGEKVPRGKDLARDTSENRRRLFALLEKAGIPPEKIETRPYTSMLQDNSIEKRRRMP
jgi:adenylate cyclase class 2